jgi:hypothetical protein
MLKIVKAKVLGPFYLLGVILVLFSHRFAGDHLFFNSDLWSSGIYVVAMALGLTLLMVIIMIPFLLFPRSWRIWLFNFLVLSLAALICATFSLSLFSFLRSQLQIGEFLNPLIAKEVVDSVRDSPVILVIATSFAIGFLYWLWQNRHDVIERTVQATNVCLAVSLVGLAFSMIGSLLLPSNGSEVAEGDQRSAVLMIIDALPAYNLRAYSSEAPANSLDSLIKRSLLFRQMRSAMPSTNPYFGILYTGRLEGRGGNDNLLARLQREGVMVRWISYHRNGIPEGSRSHINDYRGLRSFFLTHNTAWLPRLLGLNYHLVIPSMKITKNLRRGFPKQLFLFLNDGLINNRLESDLGNSLTEILLPELKSTLGSSNRSLIIFHIGHKYFPPIGKPIVLAPNFDDFFDDQGQVKDSVTEGISRGNIEWFYPPEQEILAQGMREKTAAHVAAFGDNFKTFWEALREDRQLKDTVLIVSADHGTVYQEGRRMYGVHPVEEVVRVPLFIINGGKSGTDDRRFMTNDLTESLLDFFDVKGGLEEGALSIFKNGSHNQTASLTLRSDEVDEWFLLIYEGDLKIRVNLHPNREGKTGIFRLDGFNETLISETLGPPAAYKESIDFWIKRFAVDKDKIHAYYG